MISWYAACGQYMQDQNRWELLILQFTQEGEEICISLEKGSSAFCLHFTWNSYHRVFIYEATNFYIEDIVRVKTRVRIKKKIIEFSWVKPSSFKKPERLCSTVLHQLKLRSFWARLNLITALKQGHRKCQQSLRKDLYGDRIQRQIWFSRRLLCSQAVCLFYIFVCIRDFFLYKSLDSGGSRSESVWGKLTAQLCLS